VNGPPCHGHGVSAGSGFPRGREPTGQTLGVLGDTYNSATFRDLVTAISVPLGERQFPRSDSTAVGVGVGLGLAQRSIS